MKLHPEVRKFLSKAGKKGGSSRSEAKVMAVRENGKLGGRPRNEDKDNTNIAKVGKLS
jgi:hypothetical protein